MTTLIKRYTVYFDPDIHKVLKLRALETECSISYLINEALRHELAEDQEDLASFAQRSKEPTISYETLLKRLKRNGKI